MQINKKADFVLKGGKALQPPVGTDGLELYYDVKGKKNSDKYKDKLLDMSGQGKDGELAGFDYDGVLSGYDGDNGLVFDGIEDTLELGEVEGVEVVSATKNLFDGGAFKYNEQSGDIVWADGQLTYKRTDGGSLSGALYSYDLVQGRTYTFSSELVEGALPDVFVLDDKMSTIIGINLEGSFTAKSNRVYISFSSWDGADDGRTLKNIQLEEGSTATPYVPYIPTAKMTYQLNNNVISYGEGGTVKWVKDGEAMERKGINLVRNGNFFDGTTGWSFSTGVTVSDGVAVFSNSGTSGIVQNKQLIINNKYMISFRVIEPVHMGVFGGVGAPTYSRYTTYPVGIHPVAFTATNTNGFKLTNIPTNGVGGKVDNISLINLTATFGAGNEPTIEEIQADPDKWQWLPNPMDLLEARELKGNILGDMEDIVDADSRDQQSGKDVFTEHADDSHVHVEVDGKSYQHAGSGKNLSKVLGTPFYASGFAPKETTMYYIDGQNVIVDGEVPRYSKVSLARQNLDAGTYTISFEQSHPTQHHGIAIAIVPDYDTRVYTNSEDVKLIVPYSYNNKHLEGYKSYTFNVEEDDVIVDISTYLTWDSIIEYNNLMFTKIQLEEGSTATEYELPAPTPDYPIEIESVNDFDVVSQKSEGGRNLLSYNYENYKLSTYAYMELSDKEEPLILKLHEKDSTVDMTDIYFGFTRGGKNVDGGVRWAHQDGVKGPFLNNKLEITANNMRFFSFYPATETTWNTILERFDLKIEKGTTPTPWTPSPEDITEDTNHPLIDKINLSLSEPLRSVGDVKDRLFKDSDGLWKVERKVKELELKEAKGWSTDSYEDEGYNYAYFRPVNFKAHGEVQSNILPQGAVYDNTKETLGKTVVITFNLKDSRTGVTSTDNADNRVVKIRNYLMSIEGAMVSYELATPTTETLDQELQDKLNTLKSFKDSNYVYAVQNTDNPHKEQLKPTLHATFNSKDYLKETRTLTNLLIWARELTDGELIHHNQLFLNRFNLPSDRVIGEPIEQTLNLLHGGMVGHSLEQNYTINI